MKKELAKEILSKLNANGVVNMDLEAVQQKIYNLPSCISTDEAIIEHILNLYPTKQYLESKERTIKMFYPEDQTYTELNREEYEKLGLQENFNTVASLEKLGNKLVVKNMYNANIVYTNIHGTWGFPTIIS